jgi:hypothetical protein
MGSAWPVSAAAARGLCCQRGSASRAAAPRASSRASSSRSRRLHRVLAAVVGAAASRVVRPAGRGGRRPARPGPGQEPAVGRGEARGLGDRPRAGAGAAGAAAPVGDRAVRHLRAGPVRPGPVTRADQATRFCAEIAAATIDLLTSPDATAVALCDAPGCGQLYLRGRPNQQWCNPHCGTRARSQRHAERNTRPAGL